MCLMRMENNFYLSKIWNILSRLISSSCSRHFSETLLKYILLSDSMRFLLRRMSMPIVMLVMLITFVKSSITLSSDVFNFTSISLSVCKMFVVSISLGRSIHIRPSRSSIFKSRDSSMQPLHWVEGFLQLYQ